MLLDTSQAGKVAFGDDADTERAHGCKWLLSYSRAVFRILTLRREHFLDRPSSPAPAALT